MYISGFPSGWETSFSVDMSLISEHALQCLSQSPQYNFLLSQAAGFIIPNPKWVVSSTPGIFQRQPETQPSPWWGCNPSPNRSAVGLVLSQVRQLQSAAATPGDNPPLPPDSNEVCDFSAAVNDPPGGYLTTKTTLAWLKDWRAEAHVNMHWQILVDAGWRPLPSHKCSSSHFHLLLESHHFPSSCVYMSVYDTIKQSKGKCAM